MNKELIIVRKEDIIDKVIKIIESGAPIPKTELSDKLAYRF